MPAVPAVAFVTREVIHVVCWSLKSRATLTNSVAESGSSTVAVRVTVMFVPGGSW